MPNTTNTLSSSEQQTTTMATSTTVIERSNPAAKFVISYGVDIFLLILFVIVFMIKPDPNLSQSAQEKNEKSSDEPNPLEKILKTDNEPDNETNKQSPENK